MSTYTIVHEDIDGTDILLHVRSHFPTPQCLFPPILDLFTAAEIYYITVHTAFTNDYSECELVRVDPLQFLNSFLQHDFIDIP